MKYAPIQVLPDVPAGQVFAGIDWADADHVACVVGQLAAHPDAHIFTSLPRAGMLRAARLLAEIGDCRSRFPDPQSLAALAGVAAVTRQSGTHISHAFRWAVSRQLRDAVCDFADGSRHDNAWAASICNAARGRGKDHPHAIRILARAWICVIWRCWQEGTAYDPAKHGALQRILQQQAADAAAAVRSRQRVVGLGPGVSSIRAAARFSSRVGDRRRAGDRRHNG